MQIKEKLIQKLFTDQCSREELELLFKIIQREKGTASPEIMIQLFNQLGDLPTIDENLNPRMLQRIMKNLKDKDLSIETSKTKRKFIPNKKKENSIIFWLQRSAAAVLIFLACAFVFQQYQTSKNIFIQTAYGEIDTFFLPDSSKITLNGNSSLKYSPSWSKGETRVVYLDGEAYFQVRQQPSTDAKFQVITKELTVEVLGTSFNVNSRNAESVIFLEEGKVKVSTQDEESGEVMLKPGQVLRYSSMHNKLTLPEEIVTELHTSWKDGIMEFKETTLKEILDQIGTSQNLSFEIQGPVLANRKFTLALPTENMDQAMSVLSKTTGTSITKKGNQFIIRQKMDNKKLD